MKLPKVVTISGGSGGFIVCRALSRYRLDITAIPSVFDSGGSTGVLRDVYGDLPKGDVRRCIIGLLPEDKGDWRALLSDRNPDIGPLANHSTGNLLLLAAERNWGREGGITRFGQLLGINGQIVPVAVDHSELCAKLSDDTLLCGESVIDTREVTDRRELSHLFLDPPVNATRSAIEAILKADVVVLSPGDLFTSLLPNFLVNGVTDALNETKAKIVYVVNLMTKASETRHFTAERFAYELQRYGLKRPIDYLVVNSVPVPSELAKRYQDSEESEVVDVPETAWYGDHLLYCRAIKAPLLSERGLQEGLVRHSTKALGKVFVDIIQSLHDRNIIIDLDDTLIETTRHVGGKQDTQMPPLADGAADFLSAVRGKRAILTAGDHELQRCKLASVGIHSRDNDMDVVVVDDLSAKQNMLARLASDGYTTDNTWVVDDRLDGAINFGNQLGYYTVHYKNAYGKYRDVPPLDDMHQPKLVCDSFRSLLDRYALQDHT